MTPSRSSKRRATPSGLVGLASHLGSEGPNTRLFVNGADQPCLLANDLKRADANGLVAF